MKFPRKSPPAIEPTDEDLEFQILDWYIPESDRSEQALKRARGYADAGDKPSAPPEYMIYMHGITEKGHTVLAEVHGHCPYFFLRMPEDWWKGKSNAHIKQKIADLKNELLYNKVARTKYNRATKGRDTYYSTVVPWRLKEHLEYMKLVWRKEFFGFTNGMDFPFIKIRVKSLALFQVLSRYFAEPEMVSAGFKLYESNIDPFLRFIHERNIAPCGWVRLPAGTYDFVEDDEDGPKSRAGYHVSVGTNDVYSININKIAPLLIASFDIECTSSHGDFPVARKDYRKLAMDLVAVSRFRPADVTDSNVENWILDSFEKTTILTSDIKLNQVFPKESLSRAKLKKRIAPILPDLMDILRQAIRDVPKNVEKDDDDAEDNGDDDIPTFTNAVKDAAIRKLIDALGYYDETSKQWKGALPELEGDPLIQIGTTVHRYGSDEIIYRHIVTLNSCNDIENADVEVRESEEEVILAWKEMLQRLDPDILTGYNIFGFDMRYMWERAQELGIEDSFAVGLGRLNKRRCILDERKLSSSALGDNIMHTFDMDGVVLIDMLKVMQRDQKLDSYKLDHVAQTFLGDQKDDLKPREIFEKFQGDAEDRCVIARYCLQDCALVNRLLHKLKVLENNVGMGNVCSVPLSYLFMRGQGVKIFSLVAKECRAKQYLIPVLKTFRETLEDEDVEGYEGAIVLEPQEGIYLDDPITVLDYSSLYPSSMIARNLSHDCFVNDEEYANLEGEGITYLTVEYDVYEGKGDKKQVVGKKSCKFAQLPEGKKGIIPSILQKLLTQRKNTRKKIEYERVTLSNGKEVIGLVKELENGNLEVLNVDTAEKTSVDVELITKREEAFHPFEQAVLDALQLAYKITANSLYGQVGARTSPIYWKDIAASTTATGREMIMLAKGFAEKEYGANVVYGDTDSVFIMFPVQKAGETLTGKEKLERAIAAGQRMSKEIKPFMPPPQSLEYEKTFYPFVLFSKKRYVGNLYEDDPNKKPKQKSMGIVLKRRDNAPIVKKIYGGIIDILLNKNDLDASVRYLQTCLDDLVNGKYPLEDLIITKTIRAEYKDPTKIAHKVLAERMGERDAGNKPMVNDRVPFVYIQPPPGVEVKLQGDRIEHPDYIRENSLVPDYRFYITNQLLKPISQLYALTVEKLPGYTYPPEYWLQLDEEMKDQPLYTNPKKRKDRIQALKMRVVQELLFDPYLDNLVEVTIAKKGSAGKKRVIKITAPASAQQAKTMMRMEVGMEEVKRGKAYSTNIKLLSVDGTKVEWESTAEHKGTKADCMTKGIEQALVDIYEKKVAANAGILVCCHDKVFLRTWKSAVEKSEGMHEEIRSILETQDIGRLKEVQQLQRMAHLVELYFAMSCRFEN